MIADPLFADHDAGDFTLAPSYPAITRLGFEPIPAIVAPRPACGVGGGDGGAGCLALVLG